MDQDLVQRAQRGDRAALERLLEEIAPLVHRFGLRMCRHEADAEDVLQDTLLSVADHLSEFEGRASLASWVFMLARSACARRRRGLKNQPHLPESVAADQPLEAPSPELAADQAQLRAALERALASVPEEQREVLLLRDMEGLTAAEVAASLQISVDAVKSRLHRARASLRRALDAELGHDLPQPGPGCPDVLAAFSRKLEDELGPADCAQMEKHLESCRACSERCDALRTALWACKAQAAGSLPEALRARIHTAVQALIAAL